jgi:ActR/RegA family two-component response regulator
MTIRLYIDEDSMSRALARALEARGVDVTTALAENMIEQPDTAHLDYATQ